MSGNRFLVVFWVVLAGVQILSAQPEHKRLIYSHYLDTDKRSFNETILNSGGQFLPNQGWKATSETSQLQINFGKPLPAEGTLAIRVTNFNPATQCLPEIKHHIINLYSSIADNNKDIYATDASWWNIRTGSWYSSGAGKAGFKFLESPCGTEARKEVTVAESNQWFLGRSYEFRVSWTSTSTYVCLDGQLLATLPFVNPCQAFQYLLIGKDNLIWGYSAMPGPIYYDLRIYSTGEPYEDQSPPNLEAITVSDDSTLTARFDEPLQPTSANAAGNYRIETGVTVRSAQLEADGRTVRLGTSPHLITSRYVLWVRGICDLALPVNRILEDSLSYRFIKSFIREVSLPNYIVAMKGQNNRVYSDRDYFFSYIPSLWQDPLWIETANDDKAATAEDFLRFTLEKPAAVVVAYDSTQSQTPEWLRGWALLPQVIRSSDTTYRCYERHFPAGMVTLGANQGGSSSSMYLVLASQEEKDTLPPSPPNGVKLRLVPE